MSFSEEKAKSRGKVNSGMTKKRKKVERKVSYPVDQLLPLSVKVLIGVHALVCVHRSVCVPNKEREKERERGGRGSSLLCVLCKKLFIFSAHLSLC